MLYISVSEVEMQTDTHISYVSLPDQKMIPDVQA